MYKLETLNGPRFELLQHLANGVKSEKREAVQAWCNRRWEWLLHHLHRPTLEDVPLLVRVAMLKGAEFFRDLYVSSCMSADYFN